MGDCQRSALGIINNLSRKKKRHNKTWLAQTVMGRQVMWRFERPVVRNWVRCCIPPLSWLYLSNGADGCTQSWCELKGTRATYGPTERASSEELAAESNQDHGQRQRMWEAVLLVGCAAPEVNAPVSAEHTQEILHFSVPTPRFYCEWQHFKVIIMPFYFIFFIMP